ncbi:MAG: hypothetical protein IH618_08485 [Ignavibacteriaceae bacterium]|nr:hypothetical protein [Ignavibacteriaceae bacterium]
MKKKISILLLTILFLVSTTGMPIWSHYCEMLGKKSLTECGDCKIEEVEVTSCCSENIPDNQLQYSSSNSNCCIDEFDFKKIEDNFSQSSNIVFVSLTLIIAENNLTTIQSEAEKKYSNNSNYNLPPPKFGKELLNTIHQLKLDLPVC